MRTTRITKEREPGRRGRRFPGHTARAAVLAVTAQKKATTRCLTLALVTSAVFAGLAATPASALQPGPGPGGQGPGPGSSACPKNFWAYDLKTGQQIGSLVQGSFIMPGTQITGLPSQAVVQLDFKPNKPGIECKQANIVVEYEGTPSGWTVDIGDSITNNGWGGGSGSPGKACAEVQVLNSIVTHYRDCKGSAVLPLAPALVPNPLSLQDGALKFVVKNDYVSVGQPFAKSTGTGKSFHIPDVGLPDPDGSKIFAAFNRVISDPNRKGTGVRRVMITME